MLVGDFWGSFLFYFLLFSLFQTETMLLFFIFGEGQKNFHEEKCVAVVFWWNIVEKLIKNPTCLPGVVQALGFGHLLLG